MRLNIRVTPRAKKNAIKILDNGVVKVYLTVPPIDGKANAALIELLAEEWNLKPTQVILVSGHQSRDKIVEVPDSLKLTADSCQKRIDFITKS